MPKKIDRTPSDVAYILLHAHKDSTDEAVVLNRKYPNIPAASVHAKHCLANGYPLEAGRPMFYRYDLMGYKADGTLWHDLPLAVHMVGNAGMRAAVTAPLKVDPNSEAAQIRAAAAEHRARVAR